MRNTATVKLSASWHSSLYPCFQFLQYRVSGAGMTPLIDLVNLWWKHGYNTVHTLYLMLLYPILSKDMVPSAVLATPFQCSPYLCFASSVCSWTNGIESKEIYVHLNTARIYFEWSQMDKQLAKNDGQGDACHPHRCI